MTKSANSVIIYRSKESGIFTSEDFGEQRSIVDSHPDSVRVEAKGSDVEAISSSNSTYIIVNNCPNLRNLYLPSATYVGIDGKPRDDLKIFVPQQCAVIGVNMSEEQLKRSVNRVDLERAKILKWEIDSRNSPGNDIAASAGKALSGSSRSKL